MLEIQPWLGMENLESSHNSVYDFSFQFKNFVQIGLTVIALTALHNFM